MKYYLGIDGGGTVTTAAVADENGKVIYKSTGKSINFYGVGMQKARENLAEVMEKVKTDCSVNEFYSAFIGCSALDGKAEEELVSSLCGGIIDAEKIGMNSDVYVALKASGGNCVAVCGTGSMIVGTNQKGENVVKGGWGHLLGDEGSAYSIAIKGLKAACCFWDNKTDSPLVSRALKYFGESDLRKIIDKVYSPHCDKGMLAGFAKEVSVCSQDGCETSKNIITEEAQSFAQTFKAFCEEAETVTSLCVYGGVFCNNKSFFDTFVDEIKVFCPKIQVSILSVPAEEGAIKVAMEL